MGVVVLEVVVVGEPQLAAGELVLPTAQEVAASCQRASGGPSPVEHTSSAHPAGGGSLVQVSRRWATWSFKETILATSSPPATGGPAPTPAPAPKICDLRPLVLEVTSSKQLLFLFFLSLVLLLSLNRLLSFASLNT